MTVRARYLVPLVVFVVLAGFLGWGLTRDPSRVPSPLIGRPVPQFELPRLAEPGRTIGPARLEGRVYLLNVWASWCVGCRHEHGVLMEAAARDGIRILGLNYKDQRPSARRWLERHGDPYFTSAFDASGRVGVDLGVYGVPETFVIDADGIIRHKHVGPLEISDLEQTLLPLIRRLQEPVS